MEDERNHGRAEHFLDYFLIPFPNAVRPYFFLSILERDDIFSLAINLHKMQKKKFSFVSHRLSLSTILNKLPRLPFHKNVLSKSLYENL